MNLEGFIEYIKTSDQHNHLYHVTDEANLSSIREHGILSTAKRVELGIEPEFQCGNDSSRFLDEKKGIEGYICLGLTYDHPLYHIADREGSLPNPKYLLINPEILRCKGVIFANGVANANDTRLIPIEEALASGSIDIDAIYGQADQERSKKSWRLKNAEKCEILIPDCIPVDMISEGI